MVKGTERQRTYALSFVIQLLIAPFVVHDWDGFVFRRTVRDLLSGLTPYAVAELDPTYIHLGTSWPPHNTWYAYPPLPLLLITPTLAIANAAAPWLARIALKLPFIAGTLFLAWVSGKLVTAWGHPKRSLELEKLVLLNPFIIFVSAAWGMFDCWMIALLLLSVLLIDRGRMTLAGIAFGTSALMKLFPLFAAPALLFYVALRGPRRWGDALRYAAAAIATFAFVSLPFFVPHPRGFVEQVVQMHLDRPPQGLSLTALLIEIGRLAATHGWLSEEPSFRTLATLTFGVTIGVTIATSVTAARASGTQALVRSLLGLYLGVLFTSKVLNEQYFVIPVALYALVQCSSNAGWAVSGHRAFTRGALAAGLLLGWHLLTFWPADVAQALFGHRGNVLVVRLSGASRLSPSTFAILPTLASSLALIPAFVLGTRRIVRDAKTGMRLLAHMARRFLPRSGSRLAIAAILLLPLVIQAAALRASTTPTVPWLDSNNRHVGAFYYMWWANPSHDPAIRDGNWNDGASEKPYDGYYTVNAAKLRSDFRLARSHGVDLMVTSFHEYDLPLIPTALQAAYEQDIVMAPLIELGEVYVRPEYGKPHDGFMMTPETATAILDLTSKALAQYVGSPAAYRQAGRPVVFIYDSYFFVGDWRPTTTERLLDSVVRLACDDARARGVSEPTRAEIQNVMPSTFEAIMEDTRFGPHWRRAYMDLYRDFWRGIRKELEARFGPLFIFSGESWNPGSAFYHGAQTAIDGLDLFDGSFMYSPSFVWVGHKVDPYERNWQRWVVRSVLQAQYSRGAGQPVVATVAPSYDDRVQRKKQGFAIPAVGPYGGTYDLTWQLASTLSADLVLISTWNEFFEGSGIEPTSEHGHAFLDATLDWSRRAPSPRTKRGLIVSAESSSHFANGVSDPSVLGRYARNVQVVTLRDLPSWSFDAVDIASIERADLSKYRMIIVELGMSVPSTALTARLEQWTRRGGRLLVSNATSSDWQALVHARGSASANGTTLVTASGTVLPLPPASRPQIWEVGDEVIARYSDGDGSGHPAIWFRREGDGRIVGTSMNVTGRDTYPDADATALFCLALRPLLGDDDPCSSTHKVVP